MNHMARLLSIGALAACVLASFITLSLVIVIGALNGRRFLLGRVANFVGVVQYDAEGCHELVSALLVPIAGFI